MTDIDPDTQRAEARAGWERAAASWSSVQDRFQAVGMPVSQWMIDAIEPQPGHRVLELAAGTGDLGFLAAELIAPGGGTLICSDGAEAMIEQARARAEQFGIRNVEFKPIDLEWIDLPTADVDAVLCRWGYMFAVDRDAALRETRRVLRPGGRLALATWAAPERNPWATLRTDALVDEGLPTQAPPTPFDLGTEQLLHDLLAGAGFTEIETAPIEVSFTHDDFDDYWDTTIALSRHMSKVVAELEPAGVTALRNRLAGLADRFAQPDGTLRFPGVALVAAASA